MSSSLRNLRVMSEYVRLPMSLALASALLAGCSADVTRFDFPAFGLTDKTSGPSGAVRRPVEAIPSDTPGILTNNYNRPSGAYSPEPNSGSNERYKPAKRNAVTIETIPNINQSRSSTYQTQNNNYQMPHNGYRAPGDGYGSGAGYASEPKRVHKQMLPSRTTPPQNTTDQAYNLTSSDSVVVQPGDTLYRLSRRHGVSVSELITSNGLTSPNIKIGQRLIVATKGPTSVAANHTGSSRYTDPVTSAPTMQPSAAPSYRATDGDRYQVQTGDSLYGIARRRRVPLSQLLQANNISDPTKLRVGQTLVIPGASPNYADRDLAPSPRTPKSRQMAKLEPRSSYGSSSGAPKVEQKNDRSRSSLASVQRTVGGHQTGRNVVTTETTSLQNDTSGARFRWPAEGRIVSGFGERTDGSHNDGIDIAVPIGTEVRAADNGVVAYAGSELKGYGKLILVRHKDNWVSAYAHNDQLLVGRGDKIRRGAVIAKAGRSGAVERPQLHFELRKGSKPVDPIKHLARR